jgi:hypothetical protein
VIGLLALPFFFEVPVRLGECVAVQSCHYEHDHGAKASEPDIGTVAVSGHDEAMGKIVEDDRDRPDRKVHNDHLQVQHGTVCKEEGDPTSGSLRSRRVRSPSPDQLNKAVVERVLENIVLEKPSVETAMTKVIADFWGGWGEKLLCPPAPTLVNTFGHPSIVQRGFL